MAKLPLTGGYKRVGHIDPPQNIHKTHTPGINRVNKLNEFNTYTNLNDYYEEMHKAEEGTKEDQ